MNKCPKIVFVALMSLLFFNFTPSAALTEAECHEVSVLSATTSHLFNPAWLPLPLPCGSYNDGSYGGSGYHTYTATLNLSCYSNGATVYLSVQAHDVPNRFTIKKDGGYVTMSGWLGCTSNYGYWGGPFCNNGSTTISFTKASGTYTVFVETQTDGSMTDYWFVQ